MIYRWFIKYMHQRALTELPNSNATCFHKVTYIYRCLRKRDYNKEQSIELATIEAKDEDYCYSDTEKPRMFTKYHFFITVAIVSATISPNVTTTTTTTKTNTKNKEHNTKRTIAKQLPPTPKITSSTPNKKASKRKFETEDSGADADDDDEKNDDEYTPKGKSNTIYNNLLKESK